MRSNRGLAAFVFLGLAFFGVQAFGQAGNGGASTAAGCSLSGCTFSGPVTFPASGILITGSSTGRSTFTSANSGASNFTITFPAITDTLVTLTASQTLTNKTLTAPVLTTPTLGVAAGTSLALGGATIGSNALAVTGTSNFGGLITTTGLTSSGTITASGTANNILFAGAATGVSPAIEARGSDTNVSFALDAQGTGGGFTFSESFSKTFMTLFGSGMTVFGNGADGVLINGGASGGTVSTSAGTLTLSSGGLNGVVLTGGTNPTFSTASGALIFSSSAGVTQFNDNVAAFNGSGQFGKAFAQWVSLGGSASGGGTLTTNAGPVHVLSGGGTTDLDDATINVTNIAQTSAAQTGTVCRGTAGLLTYDATLGCLTSSGRFKTGVKDLHGALDEVMQLRPVSFQYKDRPEDKAVQVGLIAEEVNKVDPRLVGYEPDGVTPRGVRYAEYTAMLTKALQEQQGEIEELRQARTASVPLWCRVFPCK